MILYTEKQLEEAYKIDCKERAKQTLPWIKLEEFRGVYEELLEVYLNKSMNDLTEKVIYPQISEWLSNEIKKTLEFEIDFEEE
jgi:hypothetical protein